MNTRVKRLQKLGLMIGGTLLYGGVQKVFSIGCPFRYFLHIYCPGCGMTHAWKSVMSGKFDKAFYYHPLYFLAPFMGGMIVFGDLFSKKARTYFWYIMATLFALVYGIRLIVHASALAEFMN